MIRIHVNKIMRSKVSVLVILMFLLTAIPGCLESTCDISGEIDNSLGFADDVVVHLVEKNCKTCPWQVTASVFAYKGVKSFCFGYDGDAKLLFDNAENFLKGDEVSEDIGFEFTAGEYTFLVDEDGTVRDSEGNIYSFF